MIELEDLRLVDHHCHGLTAASGSGPEAFQLALTEAQRPLRSAAGHFDTPLGIAMRRLCPPVLDLPAHVGPEEYVRRRLELGDDEVGRRFLSRAALESLLVDTGFAGEETSPADLGQLAGCAAYTVHRVESIAEAVLAGQDDFVDSLHGRLAQAASSGAAFKSIIAYRGGLDFEPTRPQPNEVREAVGRFRDSGARTLRCPTILRHVLYETLDAAAVGGAPIQFHTGFGDDDLDLGSANPVHLTTFIREAERLEVPVVLLHCYPYHREAGYLVAVFPNVYFDVGLTIPHVGLGARRMLAESLEMAPFSKLLYSSDASQLPELYYIASRLFREAAKAVFGRWVADGVMTEVDAGRYVQMIGAGNAHQVYPALAGR